MFMPDFLVMPAFGSCVATTKLPTGVAGPIAISQPVGQGFGARNIPADVSTIQEALNQVALQGEPGGPIPFLKVDGIKGPKTQAAILDFQRKQVKDINADGLIEPDGQDVAAAECGRRADVEIRPEQEARRRLAAGADVARRRRSTT